MRDDSLADCRLTNRHDASSASGPHFTVPSDQGPKGQADFREFRTKESAPQQHSICPILASGAAGEDVEGCAAIVVYALCGHDEGAVEVVARRIILGGRMTGRHVAPTEPRPVLATVRDAPWSFWSVTSNSSWPGDGSHGSLIGSGSRERLPSECAPRKTEHSTWPTEGIPIVDRRSPPIGHTRAIWTISSSAMCSSESPTRSWL
jgi:hypothetical protein